MKDTLQWHPAFYAGIQIELEAESDNLIFENEHQIGTKPKAIDVLITKRKDIPIKKNIGRIFRKYNIIEYKSPRDYISLDDYYKVCAYAYLFKADAVKTDSIPIWEITVTFVCKRYPDKLFGHLRSVLRYKVEKKEDGIYIIHGNVFPIQIIVTKKLSREENLWLYSLTDDIESKKEAEGLVRVYEEHLKNTLYESVMDVIVRANHKKFEEVKGMCQALVDIMQPYIDEQIKLGIKLGIEEQIEQRIEEQLEQRVEEQLEQKVEEQLELRMKKQLALQQKKQEKVEKEIAQQNSQRGMKLTRMLFDAGRIEELDRAIEDEEYRNRLFKEFALS